LTEQEQYSGLKSTVYMTYNETIKSLSLVVQSE